jgi:hypothetical protein
MRTLAVATGLLVMAACSSKPPEPIVPDPKAPIISLNTLHPPPDANTYNELRKPPSMSTLPGVAQ